MPQRSHSSIKPAKILRIGVRSALIATLAAIMGACSNPAEEWRSPGTQSGQRDADFAKCQQDSRHLTNTNGDQDIIAGGAGQPLGLPPGTEEPNQFIQRDEDRQNQAFITCMTDKGYSGK
jgi:hypothetical protein